MWEICKAFTKEFPYLGIAVTKKPLTTAPDKASELVDYKKTLGEAFKKMTPATIDIAPGRKLHTVYADFAKAGVNILFFKTHYSWDYNTPAKLLRLYPTIDSDTQTLNQTNTKAKKDGCLAGCF